METFTPSKVFVDHPGYDRDRRQSLKALNLGSIDRPILGLIQKMTALRHCFTLQSCCGHFVWAPGQDQHHLQPPPAGACGDIDYRIAYLALCIQNSPAGRALCRSLEKTTALDPDNIQFGSAHWFRRQYPNTFVLQVEPLRHRDKDRIKVSAAEARRIQRVKDVFWDKLEVMVAEEVAKGVK